MMSKRNEPIAIVGSGCRFPGEASTPSKLWKLLSQPRDVGGEIPSDRFNTTGYWHKNGSHHGLTNVRNTYTLSEGVRDFDSGFFGISPNEADSMDPQQRLLLETVYEAMESGGHAMEAMRGTDTCVYVGTMTADYYDVMVKDVETIPTHFATGSNRAIISNRVSYCFDWHGPSMTIDTACSSSLIAVHQGVEALRSGTSRVAVACGTQVILGPETYISESKMKMLSPNGRSRMWDADADGYARGEGVAAVIMKKLSDAIADGDHIECIVRETGTNQDGYSNGLTVPSTDAQAALIRQTYARAGLDLDNPNDQPQYFEAHGTGTQAGDPKEAAAIHQCFVKEGETRRPLYVGSIKTVIGHLEGAAGIAGLLKGMKSIQAGYIAPNLLFNRLNPKLEPFIRGLKVPTELTAWPELADGVPRRVSVNSFGFGGSNAHAILEQYVPEPSGTAVVPAASPYTPFVFSAMSENSLIEQLRSYSEFLKTSSDTNPADLAWTLRNRRSALPFKVAIAAQTIEQLTESLDQKVEGAKQKPVGLRAKGGETRILGVFTGQGAQWAAMGAELIRSSEFVSKRIQELEDSLNALPAATRPDWSLREEMLKGADTSRIAEAKMSQPLCTAVQVILVDLLRKAGITFAAVVGHSSGEIGAAYAAGFLSATDALRTAYYRGVTAKYAGNAATGQKGAMMAVGTSLEDAQQLVNLKAFRGRITVAAHNSPASVTLSGDADAMAHAKNVFDEEKKFARALKVDTAYHSHHMLPCGDPYIQALKDCGVKVIKNRDTSCSWFSSVNPSSQPMESTDDLEGIYWRDNMANAVLFADAVKNAVESEPQLSFAIEVGPHPALQGPALQNVADVRSNPLPYTGLLSRGKSDIQSFAQALGNIWAELGAQSIDFESFDQAISSGASSNNLVTGLPAYAWNHSKTSLFQSRKSRRIHNRTTPFHEILGVLSADSTPRDKRWTNVLKPSEISWLEGHQLQGQKVFPAAGFIAMAIEGLRSVTAGKSVETLELQNLAIPRALTFDDDSNAGVQTLVTLTGITYDKTTDSTSAEFTCYACPANAYEQEMELMASASVKASFGVPSIDALPATRLDTSLMNDVDTIKFYEGLDNLGYGYSGAFRTMTEMKRRLNEAAVTVDSYAYDEDDATVYLVHPSWLDIAFQSSFLAYSAPDDERLGSLHVPTGIANIRVNPELCASLPFSAAAKLPVDSVVNPSAQFNASIAIFAEGSEHAMVQVEELILSPFAPPTEADDRRHFAYVKWGIANPDGTVAVDGCRPSADEVELAAACERIAYYYVRKWKADITDADWEKGQEHHANLRKYINHMLSLVNAHQHPTFKKEWAQDSAETVKVLAEKYANSVDVKLLVAVGENIPAAVRGDTTILEHMLPDNMLSDYYKHGLGFSAYDKFLANMMEQMAFRYPHANILEIGAGKGGATKAVLDKIGDLFKSYTYTDTTVGSFEQAKESFGKTADKMIFKTLNIETAPASQGFQVRSYDIVVASNVLHATTSLQSTLEHARSLLKPGGWLIAPEITNNGPTRIANIMGGLAGWWTGVADKPARPFAPTISPAQWNAALRKAGFTGVETITPEIDVNAWPFSVIAAQAADDRVRFLKRPLASSKSSESVQIESLVILGTSGLHTSQIAEDVEEQLGRFCGEITLLDGLPTEDEALTLNPMSTFLNLVDLESPIWKDVDDERIDGLHRMLENAKHVLWITKGAVSGENPYHMCSLAFRRCVSWEVGHISLNTLDLNEIDDTVSKSISEHLLRQCAVDEWQGDDLLWSQEPEFLLERGQFKIPRIVGNDDQNSRMNSVRRTITKTVPASSPNVSIALSNATAALVEHIDAADKAAGAVVNVEQSSLTALRVVANTYLYLSSGKDVSTNEAVVSLSTSNNRQPTPIVKVVAPAGVSLGAVANEVLATSLVASLPSGSSLLVHNADSGLAQALSRRASSKTIRVTFTYDAKTVTGVQPSSWIKLDSRTPRHTIRRNLLSAKVTHLLDLSNTKNELSYAIAQAVPNHKRIERDDLSQQESFLPPASSIADISAALADAVKSAVSTSADVAIELKDIGSTVASSISSVIQWPTEGTVDVEMRPLSGRGLFSQDKTYLLVGMSGEMGRSWCEWMVAAGAGCVVLTSRNPKVNKVWMDSFDNTNATVKMMPLNVIDPESVATLVDTLRATCPPVAGVVNGAAFWNDNLFANSDAKTMHSVLDPKIVGSNNLDQAFYNDDLDFFITIGSAASVSGNAGQTSYAVANGYMTGLAKARRARGLNASCLDIGVVKGFGYVAHADDVVVNQLAKLRLHATNETELREIFGETILAGYKDSNVDPILTTGVRRIRDDEELPGWIHRSLWSHCLVPSVSASSGAEDSGKKSSLPVGKQLAAATSKEEALEIVKECFANKVKNVLQLADEDYDGEAPLIELGVDSLVAVEVRSWFLKELKVDVPVLKIVGGASPDELCEKAFEKLPADMLSSIGTASKEEASKPAEAPKPAAKAPAKAAAPAPKPAAKPDPKPQRKAPSPEPESDSDDDSLDPVTLLDNSEASGVSTPLSTRSVSTEDLRKDTKSAQPVKSTSSQTVEVSAKHQQVKTTPPQQTQTESKPATVKPPVKILKSGPMSMQQARFWFLWRLLDDKTTSNVTMLYKVDGALRISDLERAVRLVGNRHESLRTCIVENEHDPDQAEQKVMAQSPMKLELKKCRSYEEVQDVYGEFQRHTFNPETGDLFRVMLCSLSPTAHYLMLNYHHIIMDGGSHAVWLGDLEKAYNGESLGKQPTQYLDHAAAQLKSYQTGGMASDLAYWRSIFPAGEQPPVLPLLPFARVKTRPTGQRLHDFHQSQAWLDRGLFAQIKAVSRANRATPMHFYLAAYKAMLFGFTETKDLTIGIADANRTEDSIKNAVGMYMNLLTLRFSRKESQKFGDAISEARDTTYGALEHSRIPFDILLQELNIPRSTNHTPFFQAWFDYRPGYQEKHPWGNVQFAYDNLHPGRNGYDITLDITDTAEDSLVMIRTQKELYDKTATNLILETFVHFLNTLAKSATMQLKDTPLFSQEQLNKAVTIGRGAALVSDWPGTVPHRIDQIAQKYPKRLALSDDGVTPDLTYEDMISRIEAIAEKLLSIGVGPGVPVCVYQTASSNWPCSMFAIMRTGGIYVPLNLREPIVRLSGVVANSEAIAIVADRTTADKIPEFNLPNVIGVNVDEIGMHPAAPVANRTHADSPAAYLYTSGSTGNPKGIVIRHESLRNESEGFTKEWGLGVERVLQQSAYTFNHSSNQIYTALVNGGSVYTVPWEKRGDPLSIAQILHDKEITYTKATPSEYSLWIRFAGETVRKCTSWKTAVGGGEELTAAHCAEMSSLNLPELRYLNSYGPTEITISSTKMDMDYRKLQFAERGEIPCGYALPNYFKYVVDDNLNPLPAGMPGEVCIGGAGVSNGYLKNEALNNKAFIHNPFATPEDIAKGWTRMFRTGDIGHFLDDGALVFHSRIGGDYQVKIRGLRIELHDIESNIVASSNKVLQQATVTLREGDPDYLVAHVVFAQQFADHPDKTGFLANLLRNLPLPEYMIPVIAIPLDEMPLTKHSKVDRKALKAMPLPESNAPVETVEEEEMSETMVQLRRLWQEVLGNKELGFEITPSTSFFAIGGNSLLILRLQARIRKIYNVTVRLSDLLEAHMLQNMATKIESSLGASLINWDEETVPPTVPSFLKKVTVKKSDNSGKHVLVTGSTGFLAQFILPQLIANPEVTAIHCVAIRATRGRELPVDPKIISYPGDLSAPLLGLKESTFKELSGKVDTILHMGIVRSFWDSYHVLKPSNVQPTKEIIKLAAPRKVQIHYISTSGVFAGKVPEHGESASANPPPADGAEGYVATRWASERILERSTEALGIPSFVYRFLPAAEGPTPQANLDDFVRFIDELKVVPNADDMEGRISLAPANEVSTRLCKYLLREDVSAFTATRFAHVPSPIVINGEDFRNYLQEKRGGQGYERIPILKWFGRIKHAGWQYLMTSQETTTGGAEGFNTRR